MRDMPNSGLATVARKPAGARRPAVTLPGNARAVDEIVRRCRALVTRRSLVSAGVVLVPVPGLDIAVDIALLTRLVDEINHAFGLAPEDIEQLLPARRVLVYRSIVAVGGAMVGRLVTTELVIKALTAVGMRITAKQAARYVPIAGQIVAAGVSFGAMRYVGLRHIRDCERVARSVLDQAS